MYEVEVFTGKGLNATLDGKKSRPGSSISRKAITGRVAAYPSVFARATGLRVPGARIVKQVLLLQ
jgi:hypothetical protein